MHYDILDSKRSALLPKLSVFRDAFYLAGGTALALQMGHRESIDFDFFTQQEFDPNTLYQKVDDSLEETQKIQQESGTLTISTNGVNVSFFHYPYLLLQEPIKEEALFIASILDIGCMKLSAITSRAVLKDYVDLFYILKEFSLTHLLDSVAKKMPTLDRNFVLKALVSFDDIADEPIIFKKGFEVSMGDIREALTSEIKKLSFT